MTNDALQVATGCFDDLVAGRPVDPEVVKAQFLSTGKTGDELLAQADALGSDEAIAVPVKVMLATILLGAANQHGESDVARRASERLLSAAATRGGAMVGLMLARARRELGDDAGAKRALDDAAAADAALAWVLADRDREARAEALAKGDSPFARAFTALAAARSGSFEAADKALEGDNTAIGRLLGGIVALLRNDRAAAARRIQSVLPGADAAVIDGTVHELANRLRLSGGKGLDDLLAEVYFEALLDPAGAFDPPRGGFAELKRALFGLGMSALLASCGARFVATDQGPTIAWPIGGGGASSHPRDPAIVSITMPVGFQNPSSVMVNIQNYPQLEVENTGDRWNVLVPAAVLFPAHATVTIVGADGAKTTKQVEITHASQHIALD